MAIKVTVVPNMAGRKALASQQEVAAAMMATDIHERSAILAPKDTRNLVNSGRIERLGEAHYAVTYGSDKVPYARIQELGGQTGRNHATTIVGQQYLEQAGDSVVRGDLSKYYRGER